MEQKPKNYFSANCSAVVANMVVLYFGRCDKPAIIYSIYQYRLKQVLRLQGVRNRIATDLHDEIGSSLSTIAIYSRVAQQQLKNDAAESENLLKKISEDTNEMMDAMNDIVWTINARNDMFENIINRMREHTIQLFEAKGCALHFNFGEQLNHLKFDMEKRKDFYRVYKEALNNIAKYAEAENVWNRTCYRASRSKAVNKR